MYEIPRSNGLDGRFWPKPAPGVEWRVAGIPPKAAAR